MHDGKTQKHSFNSTPHPLANTHSLTHARAQSKMCIHRRIGLSLRPRMHTNSHVCVCACKSVSYTGAPSLSHSPPHIHHSTRRYVRCERARQRAHATIAMREREAMMQCVCARVCGEKCSVCARNGKSGEKIIEIEARYTQTPHTQPKEYVYVPFDVQRAYNVQLCDAALDSRACVCVRVSLCGCIMLLSPYFNKYSKWEKAMIKKKRTTEEK